MHDPTRPLRSLSGLMDFDSTARWGSFKLAAQELHKTPAAVSLQVKQLEEALGFPLFVRHPRHISLTEKGQALSIAVSRMLRELRVQVASLQDSSEENVLRITTTHSLAFKWLAPRLGRFTKLYPELDIQMNAGDRLVDVEDGSVDVALRAGPLEGRTNVLFRDSNVVVYSPSLLAPGQEALEIADLKRFPLLYDDSPETWIALLRENDALDGRYDFSRGFSHQGVLVQAAVAGHGIALAGYLVVHDDIQSGVLKRLPVRSEPNGRGYRFVVASSKACLPKVARFRDWITGEMQEMQQALAAAQAGTL
ncbi:LysR substrate-binding domain-containing protein [Massilia endophytica]|uniref:LysR substrate-binding domain-containing protein n=1 Tax=Massilia endophytica TaxID=2899220 RepID=UPI001E3891C4|nr:LysR substrate-binding domain-containing protein [Massilia endophytica]UGQ45806.1 LysR substrate-binding domain-containing protein [Massilia endophytica]